MPPLIYDSAAGIGQREQFAAKLEDLLCRELGNISRARNQDALVPSKFSPRVASISLTKVRPGRSRLLQDE